MSLLDDALFLQAFGYRIVPVHGKTPRRNGWLTCKWTEKAIRAELDRGADGLGLILSGLLDIDCDCPGAAAELAALGLPDTVSWQSARGPHSLYRVTPEQEIALSAVGSKAGELELRYGGLKQSVLPPSGGRSWVRSLLEHEPAPLPGTDWLPQPAQVQSIAAPQQERSGQPGDVFNRLATWHEILAPLGCTLVREREEDGRLVQDWRRPGDTEQLLSMTTGYCKTTLDDDALYLFTTSFPPLEAGKSYSKFAAYAIITHGGDFSAAARALAGAGYAESISVDVLPEVVDPSSRQADSFTVPEFPGVIAELADWHCQRAHTVDRQAGIVGGIMAVSWALGRCAKFGFDGTRANLFALMTGRPGSGKSEVAKSLQLLLSETGRLGEVCSDATSGVALEDALISSPRMLFVKDEAQDLVYATRSGKDGNAFKRSVLETIKRIYSEARGVTQPRRKANAKQVELPIMEPYLTTLMLATGAALWDDLPESLYLDGFAPRMLFFTVGREYAMNRGPRDLPPPKAFLELVDRWQPVFSDAGGGQSESTSATPVAPVLRDVVCSDAAGEQLWDIKAAWAEVDGSPVVQDFYARGQEIVCKLCMIAAASEDKAVDVAMVDRIAAFVEDSIRQKTKRWENRFTGDARYRDFVQRVMLKVSSGGGAGPGCPAYKLRDELTGHRSYEIAEALFDLYMSGQIETDVAVTGISSLEKAKKLWVRGCKAG